MRQNKAKNSYLLYIPSSIDIDRLISDNPPTFKYKRDKFLYMIYLVNYVSSVKKDYVSEFTSLYSKLLKDKFGNDYLKYIEYLITNNILVRKNQYSTIEHYSKAYKISDIHKFSNLKEVEITDYVTIKKLKNFTNLESKVFKYILPESNNMKIEIFGKWFNEKFTIEFHKAKDLLTEIKKQEIPAYHLAYDAHLANPKDKALLKKFEETTDPYRAFNRRLIPALKIKNKQFDLTIDRTVGRLHTPLSQLKKELRPFLRYDDKKLVSIDIKNSQPYLSTLFFNKKAFKRNKMGDKIKLYNDIDYNKSPIALHYVSNKLPPKDIDTYIKQVISGKFYEEFSDRLTEENLLPKDLQDSRKYTKTIAFRTLFSPNSHKRYVKEIQLFEKIYPNVYENFAFIKCEDNYNTLACVLQNIEAELILKTICVEISKQYPDAPIFTIHDSIVTTVDYHEKVKEIMHKILEEKIGYAPELSVEFW